MGFEACAAEDDAIDARIVVYNALESCIFVLRLDEIVGVIHVFSTFVAASDYNLLVIFEIALGDAFDLWSHGGREEESLTLFGEGGKDFVDAVGETHIEHFVGFVKDDVAYAVELCHLAVHQVDETTRSGNNDLTTLLELTDLSFDICTPINSYDVETIDVAAVVLQIIRNLQAEFACGAEDDDLGGAVFGVDVL